MSARLDTTPQERLRRLASSLRLSDNAVDEALAVHRGDTRAAEAMLRNRSKALSGSGWAADARASRLLSREERIRKCAAALARTPDALDLLHMSLEKVKADPHNERLRKVNVSSGVFKDRVSSKNPAGVELMYSVGYEPMSGHLVLQKHDSVLIGLALTELAEARKLSTYQDAKAVLQGAQARKEACAQDAAATASRRAAYLAKVPAEPEPGDESSACVISFTTTGSATRTTRRFHSDNTLTDIVNFAKSLSAAPDGDDVVLENVTMRPPRVLDPASQGQMSLYALDLWPRSLVQIRSKA